MLVLPGYTEVKDAVCMSNVMNMVECFGRYVCPSPEAPSLVLMEYLDWEGTSVPDKVVAHRKH